MKQAARGLAAHGLTLHVPKEHTSEGDKISDSTIASAPQHSPARHHRRESSRNLQVKETIDAQSYYGELDDEGGAVHRVNQYTIEQEIGRGSFGAVHLAVDQYGTEYAVKEFSKSRLRKRAQSNLLRRPNQRQSSGYLAAEPGPPGLRMQKTPASPAAGIDNAFDLIKEEIAIMKKLDHINLVSLQEVLDDPEEDSLYMVLEMCKKGVVMKVGLDEPADPYDDETCRCWFRDMILGVEYLHAQGIIHRDIKPDNCLVTEDDVLKIVDFGVSEMFEKHTDMSTSKSAGSPAFMPPELCVAQHGRVSGRAADIWSMGVTLFCLRYGRVPFNKDNLLDLYQAIREEEVLLTDEHNEDLRDLFRGLLAKDPDRRITMSQLRVHPWVTKRGEDPLLSEAENCSDILAPPTESEKNHAITNNMGHLLAVLGAVKKFRSLVSRRRPEKLDKIMNKAREVVPRRQSREEGESAGARMQGNILNAMHKAGIRKRHSTDELETASKTSIYEHHTTPSSGGGDRVHQRGSHASPDHEGRGQAHNPLNDTLFLAIGTGSGPADIEGDSRETRIPSQSSLEVPPRMVVSESPGTVDTPIYEEAYKAELDRIAAEKGQNATLYLTRRVEHDNEIKRREDVVRSHSPPRGGQGAATGKLAEAVQALKLGGPKA